MRAEQPAEKTKDEHSLCPVEHKGTTASAAIGSAIDFGSVTLLILVSKDSCGTGTQEPLLKQWGHLVRPRPFGADPKVWR